MASLISLNFEKNYTVENLPWLKIKQSTCNRINWIRNIYWDVILEVSWVDCSNVLKLRGGIWKVKFEKWAMTELTVYSPFSSFLEIFQKWMPLFVVAMLCVDVCRREVVFRQLFSNLLTISKLKELKRGVPKICAAAAMQQISTECYFTLLNWRRRWWTQSMKGLARLRNCI